MALFGEECDANAKACFFILCAVLCLPRNQALKGYGCVDRGITRWRR